mgnify:CR=1 FL=1
MSWMLDAARAVRHAPVLRHAEPLWRRVRPLFHRLLDLRGRGVPVDVGHGRTLRIPAVFTGAVGEWAGYEPECADMVAGWAAAHPNGVMLDLGCAMGMFATLALQYGSGVRVIAADADDASLACTRRFAHRDAGRLSLLWGLLDRAQPVPATLQEALARTEERLRAPELARGLAATRYVCLEDAGAAALPHYSLDGLGTATALPPGPLLIKCDVEGAELFVLQGAAGLIAARRPTLLLSVHPPALPKHGHCVADVAAFLTAHRYAWRVIAFDHEEHWLAEPAA